MNELLVALVHGGNWTARERRIGRWVRHILLVLLTVSALAWNHHWQQLGAQNLVWTNWVNAQCKTGLREVCMSYVDFARPSGMPSQKFWSAHPDLAATAECVERMGWLTLSVGRQDYTGLLEKCVAPPTKQQEVRTPHS
ncbi:hypothetical protein IPT12_14880 [Xanthomonas perforans]|uniref:Uncharacterized protein n=6 Tax=Xanthomonas TaxID=338 RepID=A0AAJ0J2X2_9XANT|nr:MULTISPECIES: hypothetical protein [Xanthomonas]MEB1846224.1 hypothetical protein [Xanthomonas campestris pv. campestris]APO97621.1 hypothetical protein BJD13_00015 [Xanthomonas perforans]APP78159.1 hypothetical protein BJD12_22775 [Xanthomonas vesicatoria ATCC 35937]APP87344.1 hypothetical protein BI317_25125 [Xanthomonas hortorum pv. gardneri]EGD10835.1 hypothetical protein XVE_0890 [Xanthomonas vesicatoria ATCC 35937]